MKPRSLLIIFLLLLFSARACAETLQYPADESSSRYRYRHLGVTKNVNSSYVDLLYSVRLRDSSIIAGDNFQMGLVYWKKEWATEPDPDFASHWHDRLDPLWRSWFSLIRASWPGTLGYDSYLDANGQVQSARNLSEYRVDPSNTASPYQRWVGVGSYNPQAPLQAHGELWADGFRVAPTNSEAQLYLGRLMNNLNTRYPVLMSQNSNGDWDELHFKGDPKIVLNARPLSHGLNSNANVGIGTNTPQAALDVNGKIKVSLFFTASSREFKKDIVPFTPAKYGAVLGDLSDLNVVRFRYKTEPADTPLHTGVIAEEAPQSLLAPDAKAVSLPDEAGFLLAAVKSLHEQNKLLEEKIKRLEEARAGAR